jgi:amidase
MNDPRVLQIRRMVGAVALMSLFNGCSLFHSSEPPGKHAFIKYWGSGNTEESGRLRLAVKDNIDMKGIVTTAGSEYLSKHSPPAKRDAACLAIARQRGVDIVGKTNLSEFAVSPSGINEYFGTPKSPLGRSKSLIPGGSSCGSAVSVATGLADVSFGTDTAGSVRVPAACCGIVGLKTTHGLVSLRGVYPIETEHLDTVGPLGKDIEHTVKGMDLLESGFSGRYAAAKAAKPTAQQIRVGRLRLPGTEEKIDRAVDRVLKKAGFEVIPLGEDFVKAWEQATKDGNTVAAAGAWMSDRKFRDLPGIALRTKSAILVGSIAYRTNYQAALERQAQWQRTLKQVFKKVDLIAVPTLKSPPPLLPPDLKIGLLEARMLLLQNTVAVNFAGNPAVAVPIPLRHGGVRLTSLQFVGPTRSEAELLNAGRLVELAVPKRK